jgi:hypothetical protein
MSLQQKVQVHSPPGFSVNVDLLREFELGLAPAAPERSAVPARVLGYGEISTVFEIQAESLRGLALKRLAVFESFEEMERYEATYVEYNRLLGEIGLRLPAQGYAGFAGRSGRPILYLIQKRLPAGWIGNKALSRLSRGDAERFVGSILRELNKVWEFNRRQAQRRVAIDGQLSNWAIDGFDADHPALAEPMSLFYLDTSTPLFRLQGEEQLNPELFLRNAPSFLAWLIRLFFLKDVMNRYYDPHLVAADLIANFHKEQRPDLIPALVRAVNDFYAGAAHLGVKPVEEKEVESYYREDAFIWSFYLSARRLDRFIQTRLLRREYPYILPGRINR